MDRDIQDYWDGDYYWGPRGNKSHTDAARIAYERKKVADDPCYGCEREAVKNQCSTDDCEYAELNE